MFFPSLNTLKNFRIDAVLINKLDIWLAYRSRSTYHHLNPLQFSLETGVSEEISIRMFSSCAIQSEGNKPPMMRPKYRLICPACGEFNQTVYSIQNLDESELECENCGESYLPMEHFDLIEIYFELLIPPINDPVDTFDFPKEAEAVMGKSKSLLVSDLDQPTRISLLDLYDNAGF